MLCGTLLLFCSGRVQLPAVMIFSSGGYAPFIEFRYAASFLHICVDLRAKEQSSMNGQREKSSGKMSYET
jgi:hypothetical protein